MKNEALAKHVDAMVPIASEWWRSLLFDAVGTTASTEKRGFASTSNSLVLLFCLFCVSFAQAATRTIAAGETLEISAENYDTLNCLNGSTLKFKSSYKQSSAHPGYVDLSNHIIATNGTFTIDVTELPDGIGLFLQQNFACSDVRIKGRRFVAFGGTNQGSTLSAWDVASITFLSSEGEDVTSSLTAGEGVLFKGCATIWTKPNCRYEVCDGAEICLGGVKAADFGLFTPNNDGEIVIDKVLCYIMNTNMMSTTAPIRVRPGSQLSFKPCTRSGLFNWSGASSVDLVNDVILEGEGNKKAQLIHRASKTCLVTGSVTGVGNFTFVTENYGSPCAGFVGPLDFYGRIYVHGNTGSQVGSPCDFYIAASNPGSPTNTLKIGGSTKTIFGTPNVARVTASKPTAVTIAQLEGLYETNTTSRQVYAGELVAQAGQTVTVQRVSGPVKLVGDGRFVIGQLAADAELFVSSTVTTHFETAPTAGKVIFTRTMDTESFTVEVGAAAYMVEPYAGVRAVTNAALGGVVRTGETLNYRVRGAENFTYRLTSNDSWRESLSLWIDPNEPSRYEILDYTSTPHVDKKYECVELMHDVRADQTYLLQNNYQRTATGGQASTWHKASSPYPYIVTDLGPVVGGTRLNYLSAGAYKSDSARRLYVGKEGTKPYEMVTMPAKFVVMVFGGQNGGGMALLKDGNGTTRNVFARCETTETPTLSMPIFTNAAFRTWIDGVEVNPTETGHLKSGWQVVSFRTGGNGIAGFGYTQLSYKNGGGQNYGDILVFSEELTNEQRRDVERTLSRKWGLSYPEEAAADVSVGGAGTVTVEANVRPSGLFTGTFNVAAGATLVVGEGEAVPTVADVAQIGNRVNWFDPTEASTLRLLSDNKTVSGIYDRVDGSDEGHWMLYGTGGREPRLVPGSRSFGAPERPWMDFADLGGDNMGNTLRYRPTPFDRAGNDNSEPNYSNNVQTVCLVYDSCRVGTPAMDAIAGTGLAKCRTAVTDPIWISRCSPVLKNGKQYLDGVEVNGTTVPFGGKPQVFSFTTVGDFPLMCLGDYHVSQSGATGGEVLGEALFFSTVLSDADRQKVESYLSAKWLGVALGAQTDLSGATVTGAGAVQTASLAALPQFASGFAGTITVTNEAPACAFTVNGDTVTDARDLGNGTLVSANAIAVSVAFTARPSASARTFKLVSWADGKTPEVAFVLAGGQPTGAAGAGTYALRKAEDGLYLDRTTPGFSVFFR